MGRRIASPENFTEPLSIASPNMLLLPHSAGDPAKRARGGNGLNYWQPRLTPMARYSANSRLGQRLVLERPPATGSGANASPGRVSMTALGHQQRFYTVRPWSGQPHTADLSKNSPSIPLSAKSGPRRTKCRERRARFALTDDVPTDHLPEFVARSPSNSRHLLRRRSGIGDAGANGPRSIRAQ
jgi:hypothetical protein